MIEASLLRDMIYSSRHANELISVDRLTNYSKELLVIDKNELPLFDRINAVSRVLFQGTRHKSVLGENMVGISIVYVDIPHDKLLECYDSFFNHLLDDAKNPDILANVKSGTFNDLERNIQDNRIQLASDLEIVGGSLARKINTSVYSYNLWKQIDSINDAKMTLRFSKNEPSQDLTLCIWVPFQYDEEISDREKFLDADNVHAINLHTKQMLSIAAIRLEQDDTIKDLLHWKTKKSMFSQRRMVSIHFGAQPCIES